jgi:YebC/PmpR family DNA-binding regulatory protein
MAGHSKWNNIKHRKGAVDAKRSKIFTNISKLIKSAVREGNSGDPDANPYLRPILEKARAANMPKEKVQRAIDRGLGKTESGSLFQEILYEGFGPGGVACLVQASTDNPNRTGGEVRHIFTKNGGSLGGPNSANYMFTRSADGTGFVPNMLIEVENSTQLSHLQNMVESLREYDDVEDVYVCANLGETEDVQDA